MAIKLGQTYTGGTNTGGINSQALQQTLGAAAAKKGDYGTAFSILNSDVSGLSADDKKRQQSIARGERVLSTLEDYYFKNRLAKGMTLDGVMTSITGAVDRRSPYFRYKRALKSARVALARVAGDVGNLAIQEQLSQEKAIPDALYNEKDAKEQFNLMRQNLGLKPRKDY